MLKGGLVLIWELDMNLEPTLLENFPSLILPSGNREFGFFPCVILVHTKLHFKTIKSPFGVFTAALALRSHSFVVAWCVFLFCFFGHLSLYESQSH